MNTTPSADGSLRPPGFSSLRLQGSYGREVFGSSRTSEHLKDGAEVAKPPRPRPVRSDPLGDASRMYMHYMIYMYLYN